MPLSCAGADCLSDLLCDEDAGNLSDELPECCSSDLGFPVDIEESLAGFVEGEADYVPRFNYHSRFQSQSLDASARRESVGWILKVHAFFRFQPLTAYLSVNYMDRFLASRVLPLASGWPLQLLTVACLSLAAKMEEAVVPSLLDLQVESTKFVFEPLSIRRMELLILGALDWRLRSVTPFTFIDFFAYKVDKTGTFTGSLVSRATQIILSIITDISFLDYWPSSVAAAAILSAAHEIPKLSLLNPGNAVEWCHGLSKDSIVSCYQLMQKLVVGNNTQIKRSPKILPQLRVRSQPETTTGSGTDYSISSSSSSLSSNKRRKLNNS